MQSKVTAIGLDYIGLPTSALIASNKVVVWGVGINSKVVATLNQDENYYIVEPNIQTHQVFKIRPYQAAIKKADIVAFLIGHKEFKKIKYQ